MVGDLDLRLLPEFVDSVLERGNASVVGEDEESSREDGVPVGSKAFVLL